jgi:hypothetical protein
MNIQLTNRHDFTIIIKIEQNQLVKLKLLDKVGCKYKNVSLIIKHKNIFRLISNYSQAAPFALNALRSKFNGNPNSFFVQKQQNQFFVIFDKYGLRAGGRKTAMAAGALTAVAGIVAVVTAPFWVPPVAAFVGVSTAVLVPAAGIASTTAVASGAQVTGYGYNTSDEQFENWQCAKEAFKGATKGAVGGALITAGTITGGAVAPIIAYGVGGAASEVTHELLEGEKLDAKKVAVAAAANLAGGAVAKFGASFKVPTDHMALNALKGGATGLTSGFVQATITEYADSENLSFEDKATNVALNAGIAMLVGSLSGAAQAKVEQQVKQNLYSIPSEQNEVSSKPISNLSKLEKVIDTLEQQGASQTQTLLENKQRLRALLIMKYQEYLIDKHKGELCRAGRDASFDKIFEVINSGRGKAFEYIEKRLYQTSPQINPIQIAKRNLDDTQNRLATQIELRNLLNLTEQTTKHAPKASSIFKEVLKPESKPIKSNCTLKEMVPHIILVHAIHPDAIGNCEGELSEGFDWENDDENYKASFIIQKILTSDGRLGQHLQFSNVEFITGLQDRPHIHWSWNQLVPPNRINSWEEARVALLEPLSSFEDSTDHKPYCVAPYDTTIIGEHCLSERSIILVPRPILRIARAHFSAYRGKVIGYDPSKTLRVAIFEILNKKYPNIWHICTEKGQLLGPYRQSPTETGYRSKTIIRKEDGTVVELLEGENRALSQSMKEYLASKRFIGLHENSVTIMFEKLPYFKLLKDFKNNKNLVTERSYFRNPKYENYRFAGHVDSAEDVEKLVVLQAFNLTQLLNKYDTATGIQDYAKYIMRETIRADLASCCSRSDEPLAFHKLSIFDFKLIFETHYDSLMHALAQLSDCMQSRQRKEEAFDHFTSYCKLLLDSFKDILIAKKEIKKELGKLKMKRLTDEMPFGNYATEEWEKVTIPKNIKFSFKNNQRLEKELYNYIIRMMSHLPGDLQELKLLYIQIFSYDQNNLTNGEKYRLNVLECVIKFLLQGNKFLQLQGFGPEVLTDMLGPCMLEMSEFKVDFPSEFDSKEIFDEHTLLCGKIGEQLIQFSLAKVKGDGNCGLTALGAKDRSDFVEALLTLANDASARESLYEEIYQAFSSTESGIKPFSEEWEQLLEQQSKVQNEWDNLIRELRSNIPKAEDFDGGQRTELIRWLQEHDQEGWADKLIAKNLDVHRAEESLRVYCCTKEVYTQYVNKFLSDENRLWVGHASAILFSKANSNTLYIWELDSESSSDGKFYETVYLKAEEKNLRPIRIKSQTVNQQANNIIHLFYPPGSNHFDLLTEEENERGIEAPSKKENHKFLTSQERSEKEYEMKKNSLAELSCSSQLRNLYPLNDHEVNWHTKVLSTLSNDEISAKEILDIFSENAEIKEYYSKPAGVIEGYTVGQHTEMVLELAQSYRTYFKPQISEYLKWGEFLLFLALHDIGKGVSKEIVSDASKASKELELETSQKILTKILEQLWMRSHIGHIFQALLMYDSQGDYLKGNIDAECFKGHLLNMSAVSGLEPGAFYHIYTIFHLVDAASYPTLHSLFIFEEQTLTHCEANQSLIEVIYKKLV